MEEFERKLKRAGFRSRRDAQRASVKPIDQRTRKRRARRVSQKLREMGLEDAVCLGCGSTDLSTFEFDHIAGRKHDDQLWPLCQDCHQEKTFMGYLDPTATDSPTAVFDVIGHWLLNLANYGDLLIRFIEVVITKLRLYGEFLVGLAKQGYGSELALPS
jgi:hypothetical protein